MGGKYAVVTGRLVVYLLDSTICDNQGTQPLLLINKENKIYTSANQSWLSLQGSFLELKF